MLEPFKWPPHNFVFASNKSWKDVGQMSKPFKRAFTLLPFMSVTCCEAWYSYYIANLHYLGSYCYLYCSRQLFRFRLHYLLWIGITVLKWLWLPSSSDIPSFERWPFYKQYENHSVVRRHSATVIRAIKLAKRTSFYGQYLTQNRIHDTLRHIER